MKTQTNKKVLVVLAHPDIDSYCAALAQAYYNGALNTGAEVKLLKLSELQFDPILHLGYKQIQALEPDLVKAQELIKWAEHIVWVFPSWWGTFPALLKGFIDRIFLPRFAFKYRPNSPFWDKLLTGRTATLIITADAPGWYQWLINGRPGYNAMKKAILEYSGFKVVGYRYFAPIKSAKPEQFTAWLAQIEALGAKLG